MTATDLSAPDLFAPDLSTHDLSALDLSARDLSTPNLSTPNLSTLSLSPSPPDVSTIDDDTSHAKPRPDLSTTFNIASHVHPPRLPSHRSHSPTNNLKRSSPFQFGSRYLEQGDNIYEFNAWDHVTPDPLYTTHATQQYALQRASPVSDYDRARFNADPAKWWNQFYRHNTTHFFKDRNWLRQEFPILDAVTRAGAGPKTVLEIGAGAGNTAFPILAGNANEALSIWACDFSKKAVELVRANAAFDARVMRAEVWDVASATETLPRGLRAGSVDVVLMVFVFSALAPGQWAQAVRNVWGAVRPGGEVCLRDYGRGDLAQVRFRKGRFMGENFYVRGDGTRVYFFEREELERIWGGEVRGGGVGGGEGGGRAEAGGWVGGGGDSRDAEADGGGGDGDGDGKAEGEVGFEILSLGVDRRLLVNRQRKLKMYRCWMQGRFRKRCETGKELPGSAGDDGAVAAERLLEEDQALSKW